MSGYFTIATTFKCAHCEADRDLQVVLVLKTGFRWEGCQFCLEKKLQPLPSEPRSVVSDGRDPNEAVKTLLYDLGLRGLTDKQRTVVSAWLKENCA